MQPKLGRTSVTDTREARGPMPSEDRHRGTRSACEARAKRVRSVGEAWAKRGDVAFWEPEDAEEMAALGGHARRHGRRFGGLP